MKKTIIFASVALATLFAFSSCQKENLQDNGTTNGVRIITAEFENNATKTDLNSDGVTPEWAVGDVLRILNATTYQDVTLISGEDTPTNPGDGIIKKGAIVFAIPGTMTGTLYAVYPASATTMESCGGNITFTIPAIQDGTFASANICVAKSTEEDENNKNNLIFSNATAVLKITTAADVVGVDVTAANKIAGNVTASFDGSAVSLTTTALDKNYVSAVGSSAPTGNVFYLATAPVTTGAAKVNCYTTEKKGTVEKESKDLSKNIIYNMDLTSVVPAISNLTGQHGLLNGHEGIVVDLGTTLGMVIVATMNVGAKSVNGSDCLGTPMTYDEACAAWSGWRLPTVNEIKTLCDVEYPTWGDTMEGEGNGALLWDFDNNLEFDLYLPLNDYEETEVGTNPYGKYWTGTPGENDTEKCFYFAPELDYDSGSDHNYVPVAYDYRSEEVPYKAEADKDSEFLVRLFHDLP